MASAIRRTLAGALALALLLGSGLAARAQEGAPPADHVHVHAAPGPQEPLASLEGRVDLSPVRDLAVQDGGRRKPLDTYAREKVSLILGTTRYQGQDPLYTLFSLLFETDRWEAVPALTVKHQRLVELLGKKDPSKSENTAVISMAELNASEAFDKEYRQIQADDNKMTGPFQEAVLELHHRRLFFYNLASALRVAPVPGEREGAAWSSILELQGQPDAVKRDLQARWREAATSWRAGDAAAAGATLAGIAGQLRGLQGPLAPPSWKLSMERVINVSHPLSISYWTLIFAACVLGGSVVTGGRKLYLAGMVLAGAGTAVSVAGLVARTIIVERAPVSNLYEAATFAVGVSLVIGLFLELSYRNGVFATAASIFAALGGLLIDKAGMDPTIATLQPVLRSYWLNIHVTCMLTSYATFAIAFIMGVWYFAKWLPPKWPGGGAASSLLIALPLTFAAIGVADLFFPVVGKLTAQALEKPFMDRPELPDYGFALVFAPGLGMLITWLLVRSSAAKIPYEKELELKTIERYVDRVSMIGLSIITAGILLGAVWANESWGRYWGWDPKETWAFITWMVYAVYVHGRIAGWFRGAAAAIFPVIGFYSVLFTFFGVSFVLPGLHSYLKK